jgi:hypothetical protein
MKINGNLTLNAGGTSEIQNAIIERVAALPTAVASEAGRIVFYGSTYYFNTGTTWTAFATGGNAAALQTEVDAIEVTLGAGINGNGNLVPAVFTGFAAGATSFTDAINKVAAAAAGKDALSQLDDVFLGTLSNGQTISYNTSTGKWNNHTLVLADITDVTTTSTEVNQLHLAGATQSDFIKLHGITASAADVNILTGTLVTATELGYVHGVTSAIQTQIDGKQPLDGTLTGIAALGSITATNSLLFTSDGVTFTYDSGAGAASKLGLVINSTIQAYDADLTTIGNFAPLAGSTGDGHTGTTQYDFMVGTGTAEGSRWVLQRGATARTSLGLGDIAIHDDAEYVRVDGTHAMANALNMGGFTVSNMGTPVYGNDATTKAYVDALVSAGATWRNPIVSPDLMGFLAAAPTSPVASYTYVATAAGTWGTLPVAANDVVEYFGGAWVKIKTLAVGDRFIIAGEHGAAGTVDASITGLTVSGSALGKADLIQYLGGVVTSAASWSEPEGVATAGGSPAMAQGITVLDSIDASTDYGNTYLYDATTHSWVEIAGPGAIGDGVGLSYSGNVLNVNLGAGIFALPTDEIGIDLYDTATSAIILTDDGHTRATTTSSKLHLLLDLGSTGQLIQSANGVKVAANTISPTELTASVAGNGLTGGAGSALAVVSAIGTPESVGKLVITADTVGVALGNTSTTAAPGDHIHAASAITYSVEVSGLSATNVQDAIDEVQASVAKIQTFDENLLSEVNTIEDAVGLTEAGEFVPHIESHYLGDTNSLFQVDTALDNAIYNESVARIAVDNRLSNSYFLYDAVTTPNSATVHTINHNIGQKYCNVTVVDNADEVIIPQSIVFNDAYTLTVTFNVAITCKVVVMGVAPVGA